ncbi:MAG TPA: ectonucleotide pyrophosphatase/phosphodiesterase, partial [Rhodanobacter sp.]|nr:ectonucleotide pyrophosphatase/phosphodiesterase [Rhodanobacter sp.]
MTAAEAAPRGSVPLRGRGVVALDRILLVGGVAGLLGAVGLLQRLLRGRSLRQHLARHVADVLLLLCLLLALLQLVTDLSLLHGLLELRGRRRRLLRKAGERREQHAHGTGKCQVSTRPLRDDARHRHVDSAIMGNVLQGRHVRMKFPFRYGFVALLALVAGCATQPATPIGQAPAARPDPVLLVSIDGFRADYFDRGLTPTLAKLAQTGVHAAAMQPSFPSLTFPNHYTLVTGLYPEHHGIVGNSFYDPSRKERYTFTDPKSAGDGSWYGGTPLWSL